MNWTAPEDEDFKEAKDQSSASTEDEFGNKDPIAAFDEEIENQQQPEDKVGDIIDCYGGQGKVVKEILAVGSGNDKPRLGSLCSIKYIAYFFDKEMFDKTPDDSTLDFYLGDVRYIEGLWRGVSEMRVGEKAKIKMKQKYAFGRPGEIDKLVFPKAYASGERRAKLTSKKVIYEVELVQFVQRVDIDQNGTIFKQVLKAAEKGQIETPADLDDIVAQVVVYQNNGDIFKRYEGTYLYKSSFNTQLKQIESPLIRRLIEAMKVGEHSEFTVIAEQFNTQDEDSFNDDILPSQITDYDSKKNLYVDVKFESLVKVEDWYKDGTTLVKTLRKGGKGRSPYADSTIKFRLKVEVNSTTIFTNYPEQYEQNFDDLSKMTPEQREQLLEDPSLLTVRIDDYKLPSILIKLVKSLKKNSVVVMETTRIDKLHKNFASEFLDQYKAFKEGDKVTFTVSLYSVKNTSYFYKLKVVEKLAYIEKLKSTAGEFFKQPNVPKAAKIYQKINGYYNFGDVANNYTKEEGEEYDANYAKLIALKQICFQNVALCKFKMNEWQSVVAITDQVLDMSQDAVKALWLRGKSFEQLKEWDNAIDALSRACKLEPNNQEFRKGLEQVKQKKVQEFKAQNAIYSKMFK